MAHSRSALKRWRQNLRRRARNKAVRSATRTYVKKAIAAIEQAAPNVLEVLREAQSALDRAAKKGVLHPNAAARRKSRLMRRLHAMQAQAEAAVATEAEAAAKPAPKARASARTSKAKTTAESETGKGRSTAKATTAKKTATKKA